MVFSKLDVKEDRKEAINLNLNLDLNLLTLPVTLRPYEAQGDG